VKIERTAVSKQSAPVATAKNNTEKEGKAEQHGNFTLHHVLCSVARGFCYVKLNAIFLGAESNYHDNTLCAGGEAKRA
jgi:hypothetical protein